MINRIAIFGAKPDIIMEIQVIIPPHTTAALHENLLATAPVSGPEK